MEEWHKQIPDYEIAAGAQVQAHGGQVSLLNLPLSWDR